MSPRSRLGLALLALLACTSPSPPGGAPPPGTPKSPAAPVGAPIEAPRAADSPAPTRDLLAPALDPAPAPPPILPPDERTPTAAVPSRPGATTVEVDKTAFRITLPDGHVLTPDELVGVALTVRDEVNAWRKIRIERVLPDPRDPEITLYQLAVQDPTSGAWGSLCGPGPDGLTLAMPLAGTWSADGRHAPSAAAFNVTCTAGAIGKCVRFGYKPWATTRDGVALWDHHQACVRMVRGDYCGDGHAWTRDGMLIDVEDALGIQTADGDPAMALEAGWGPDGALCVHHPRVPDSITLAALEARCPERLRGRTGDACTLAALADHPHLLLRNRSAPPP